MLNMDAMTIVAVWLDASTLPSEIFMTTCFEEGHQKSGPIFSIFVEIRREKVGGPRHSHACLLYPLRQINYDNNEGTWRSEKGSIKPFEK